MIDLFVFSFDACLVSMMFCAMLREVFILALPDQIAGPGGWFINTRR